MVSEKLANVPHIFPESIEVSNVFQKVPSLRNAPGAIRTQVLKKEISSFVIESLNNSHKFSSLASKFRSADALNTELQ